jgi:hypothetical protein
MQRMDFETLVQTRKSVRGFTREPVARAVIEDIMTCVAMGYPDDSFPANAVRSDREANGDFVRYVGFSD